MCQSVINSRRRREKRSRSVIPDPLVQNWRSSRPGFVCSTRYLRSCCLFIQPGGRTSSPSYILVGHKIRSNMLCFPFP
jgi:hypothetical protein